ncbi:TPA: 30S ribosomal protein S21 [Candidatus Poribacteria bacterium]|nr:30S ribosomal protein S21 [Candidatus Poribacteria bacterium]
MPLVRVEKGESIDKALSRFKKLCDREQLLKEIKRRERYEKPSEQRRRKLLKAQRKMRQAARRANSRRK